MQNYTQASLLFVRSGKMKSFFLLPSYFYVPIDFLLSIDLSTFSFVIIIISSDSFEFHKFAVKLSDEIYDILYPNEK
jgi:hypothetical protein